MAWIDSQPSRLARSLGLGRLSLYGVGTIIGGGICSVIGPAASVAGDGIWLSFLLAAAISGFSGLSYAEIATAMPSAGAEHSVLRRTFPKFPVLAFTVGLSIAVHGAGTLSTMGRLTQSAPAIDLGMDFEDLG